MKRSGAKPIYITNKLKQAADKALAPYHVLLVYVYGSAITGHMHKESDIDLAVLFSLNMTARQQHKELLSLHQEFATILDVPHEAIDITVLNKASSLSQYLAITGSLLYASQKDARLDFELDVLRRRDDEKLYRQQKRQAFLTRLAQQSL